MQTSLKIFDNCCKNTFHVQYPLFRVIGAVNVGLELENQTREISTRITLKFFDNFTKFQ